MALGSDNPIPSPENMTGLDSLSSGFLLFVTLLPISDTEGAETLTTTMPALLNPKDPVTKLP